MTWMYCIQGEVVEGDIGYHIALAAGGGLIAASAPQHTMAPCCWSVSELPPMRDARSNGPRSLSLALALSLTHLSLAHIPSDPPVSRQRQHDNR